MKKFYQLALVASTVIATSATAQQLQLAWESEARFKGPESAIYDAQRDVVYISNVNGAPTEKDGNGFISKIGLDGKIIALEWVTELDAPKGLALVGNKLYVSDIDSLIEIDVDSNQVANRYQAADAKFLNDVTADEQGNVYVSDMMTNTVYRLSGGKFESWLKDDRLANPNGLLVEDDQLIVGSWGKMTDGFKTDVPGHLRTVSISDRSIKDLGDGTPVGNLDGVESDGKGNYYVTDWMAGKLFHIKPNGEAQSLLDLGQGSADHEVIQDKGLVLIPMMNDNKVVAYKIAQ